MCRLNVSRPDCFLPNRFLNTSSVVFRQIEVYGSPNFGVNCQLSPLAIFSVTSADLLPDENWDIYDKNAAGRCASGHFITV
jgi:hypothetical protein